MSTFRSALDTVSEALMLSLILCTSSSSARRAISSLESALPLMMAAGVSGKAGRALIPRTDCMQHERMREKITDIYIDSSSLFGMATMGEVMREQVSL